MASKPFNPDRPTIYVDQSHLCDAFKGACEGQEASLPFAPLLPWAERVAYEANLCLSIMHLAELARWGDMAVATRVARWIDDLPILWVDNQERVMTREAHHWFSRAMGLTPPPVKPFAPSMLTSFAHLSADAASELLGATHPVEQIVDDMRSSDFLQKPKSFMQNSARRFRDDRKWADEEGWSEDKKREHLREREVDELLSKAQALFPEMTPRELSPIAMLVDDPAALPAWRIANAFIRGFGDRAAVLTAGSGSERKLGSDFFDYQHVLVGAAYCDVFTCDERTRQRIADVRARLGLPPPLSSHGTTPDQFTARLMGIRSANRVVT